MPEGEKKKAWQDIDTTPLFTVEQIDELIAGIKPEVAERFGGVIAKAREIFVGVAAVGRGVGEFLVLLKGL